MSIVFTVRNFQGIEECEVTFDRFITFFGDTNNGKSCLIRALDALLNNTWEKSYMRRGAKECELHLKVPPSERHTVSYVLRRKSKSGNYYEIGYVDGTKTVVKKAGGHAPPEALAEMGFAPVVTDRDDKWNMNFQFQLDSLFMVKAREPELTAFLNKMFQIDKYEGALRAIQRDLVKQDQGFKAAQAKKPELQQTIEELSVEVQEKERVRDSLKEAIERTEKLQESLKGIETGFESFAKVEALQRGLETLRGSIGSLDLLLPRMSSLVETSEQWVLLHQKGIRWESLSKDQSWYSEQEQISQEAFKRVSDLVSEAVRLEQIGNRQSRLQQLEGDLLPLKEKTLALEYMCPPVLEVIALVSSLGRMEGFIQDGLGLKTQISSMSGKEEKALSVKKEFGVWKSLTFADTECPTCGQMMKGQS